MKKKKRVWIVMVVMGLFVVFGHTSCDKDEPAEPTRDRNVEVTVAPEVNFALLYPGEEALLKDAIRVFREYQYVRNGLLHIDAQCGQEIGIPDHWFGLFIQQLEFNNQLILQGYTSLEALMQTGVYSTSPGEPGTVWLKNDGDIPHVEVNNFGGNFGSVRLSHEAVMWILYGGLTLTGLLNQLGIGWAGLFAGISTGFLATHYALYGSGGGMTIYVMGLGTHFNLFWVTYNELEHTDGDE